LENNTKRIYGTIYMCHILITELITGNYSFNGCCNAKSTLEPKIWF